MVLRQSLEDAQDALQIIVVAFFTLCTAGFVAALLLDEPLKPLLDYGKTLSDNASSAGAVQQTDVQQKSKVDVDRSTSLRELSRWLASWQVSRRHFRHFYLLSTLLASAAAAACVRVERIPVAPGLMLVHSFRRLLETRYLERPSGSTMWIGHYLVGLGFYLFANLAYLLHTLATPPSSISQLTAASVRPIGIVAIVVFVMANAVQWHAHATLAHARASLPPGRYIDLRRGLFAHLATPHYTAEVVLYLGIALASASIPSAEPSALDDAGGVGAMSMTRARLLPWLPALWTLAILSLSARSTDAWGRKRFPRSWDKDDQAGRSRRRWVMLPFVY